MVELTVNQMQKIIDGAKSWSSHYRHDTCEYLCCWNEDHFYMQELVRLGVKFSKIDDIRKELLCKSC